MRYRSLDGLRGLAAYAVVVSHFASMTDTLMFPFFQAGRLGVMLFFVLSGFLMGTLYLKREFTFVEMGGFFRKRVARVVPLYFLVVLVSYGFLASTGKPSPLFNINNNNLLQHLLFLKGTDVLWTVAAEIQFYAIFPLIWLVFRKSDAPTTALCLLFVIGACLLFWSKSSPVFFRVLSFFLLGIMASMLEVRRSRFMDLLFVLSACFVFFSLPNVKTWLGFPAKTNWDSALHMTTMFVLLLSAANSGIAERLIGNRVMSFFGTISYSVYILHLPMLRFLKRNGLFDQSPYVSIPLMLLATTIVAALSFYLFENPLRRFISGERTLKVLPDATPSRMQAPVEVGSEIVSADQSAPSPLLPR